MIEDYQKNIIEKVFISIYFKKYFEETQNSFRFYTLKDKEIAGLGGMTENKVYLFDCKCVSIAPTEVYELEYIIFKEALEDYSVKMNNDEYVSMKKEILSSRLYRQRDSISKNEFIFIYLNLKMIKLKKKLILQIIIILLKL